MPEHTPDLLLRVTAATAGLAGSPFLRRLLRELTEQLPAAIAFVAEAADDDRDDRLHVRAWSRLADSEHDALEAEGGLPLADLLGDDVRANAAALRERFWRDPLLSDPRIASAVAVPMNGSDRAPLGHLGIMDTTTTGLDESAIEALRLLAARVAIVIERQRGDRALRALVDEQGALLRISTLVAQAAPPERLLRSVTTEAGLLYAGETARTLRYEGGDRVRVMGCWSEDGVLKIALDDVLPIAGDAAAAEVARTRAPSRVDD